MSTTPRKDQLHALIIAHPDDESMFFLPSLRDLKASGGTVWIICLTNGDYDGLGETREVEMLNAGRLLDIDRVIIIKGNNRMKDHPSERWNIQEVQQEIQKALEREIVAEAATGKTQCYRKIQLITFDEFGVSGHVNHIDAHYGVKELAKEGTLSIKNDISVQQIPLEAWALVTERNILRKYVPFVSWFLLILSLCFGVAINPRPHAPHDQRRVYRLHKPLLNWVAMQTHQSQFVWYRRLFVVFSCYTYVNTLQVIQNSKIHNKNKDS